MKAAGEHLTRSLWTDARWLDESSCFVSRPAILQPTIVVLPEPIPRSTRRGKNCAGVGREIAVIRALNVSSGPSLVEYFFNEVEIGPQPRPPTTYDSSEAFGMLTSGWGVILFGDPDEWGHPVVNSA